MRVQEDQIIKLHLAAGGKVWYSDGIETPVSSSQDQSGFVRDLAEKDSPHVRVLGTRENAPLIVDLYQRCCSPRHSGKLEVATPLLCETDGERHNPEIALYRMRQCRFAPSLGGWHQVTPIDYPTYAIAGQLDKDEMTTEHSKRLLETHPAWHDLTFLPTINGDAAVELLAHLLDPRWFVDPRNPYRLAKIMMFLGLNPRYMRQVTRGEANTSRAVRCRTALTAWRGEQPTPADIMRPGNFLWRRWQAAGGGWRGDLRATQAFICYLVRTWQQQIADAGPQQLEMFIPESLLKGDAEIQAYKEHAKTREPV